MDKANPSRNSLIRITGAVVALFSLAVGALVMFVLPSRCSFVTSIVLVMMFLTLIGGGVTFLVGQFLLWRERRLKPV